MSENGVPPALLMFASLFVFVAGWIVIDFLLIRSKGDDWSITYGVRYIARHYPLLWTFIVVSVFFFLGGLIVHLVGAPSFFWE